MGHGQIKIGVIHDQHRVFRPHLHLQFRQMTDGGRRDLPTHRDRSGKADGIHGARGNQPVAHRSTRTHDQIERAARQVGAGDDLGQGHGRSWRQVGRFPHHRIAKRQCRGNFPCRCGDGEVPRRDYRHNADGFAADLDVDAKPGALRLIALQAQRLGGKPGKELPGAVNLALGFGDWLAFFAGQKHANLAGAGHQFAANCHQNVVPLLDARRPPQGLRGPRRLQRQFQLFRIGLGIRADQIRSI